MLLSAFTACGGNDNESQHDAHNYPDDNEHPTFYRSSSVTTVYEPEGHFENFHLASLDVLDGGEMLFYESVTDTLYVEIAYSYEWLNDSVTEYVEGIIYLPLRVTPDFLHRTINFENISPLPFPEILPDSI